MMQYEKEKARCSSQGKRLLTNLAFLYISCTRLFTGLSRRNIHEYKHNIASETLGTISRSGVGNNDPTSPIVPFHDVVQVLRFLALSDSECGECCVVESKLVYCQPSYITKDSLPGGSHTCMADQPGCLVLHDLECLHLKLVASTKDWEAVH